MARDRMVSLTHRQIADVLRHLDMYCIKTEDGKCRYTGEWDDSKIAESVKCHIDQVARLRRVNGWGNVVRDKTPEVGAAVKNALSELIFVVADLIERLGDRDLAKNVRAIDGRLP